MKDENLYILLHIVNTNGNINRLRREGMSYHQIALLTTKAIKIGYIKYDQDDNILLSDEGSIIFKELDKSVKKKDKNNWIEPEEKSRVARLKKDFIFIPLQDELNF